MLKNAVLKPLAFALLFIQKFEVVAEMLARKYGTETESKVVLSNSLAKAMLRLAMLKRFQISIIVFQDLDIFPIRILLARLMASLFGTMITILSFGAENEEGNLLKSCFADQ